MLENIHPRIFQELLEMKCKNKLLRDFDLSDQIHK